MLRTVASYIIVTEFCERLAYYGFAGSLVLFFQTKIGYSNEEAVNAFYLWNGAVYVTPLLGGYIADSYLGRYLTILVFSIVYLLGLALFILGEIPGSIKEALIFSGMYLVALGAGGIKPNCSTMGADQFDIHHDQDIKESKQFFSYFYWSINLGALVSYTLIAYICQYGFPFLGGPDWGFFAGYMIPTAMLAVGVMIFVSGSARYKKNAPEGSMISVTGAIIGTSLLNALSSQPPIENERLLDDSRHETKGSPRITTSPDTNEKSINATLRDETGHPESVTVPLLSSSKWLDKVAQPYGGKYSIYQVESVKYIVRLVPFLAVMIPYWGIYGQTKTAFQIQGCQMDLNLGSFQFPVSTMNIFNNITILALVPLFEKFLYPYIKSKGYDLTMLRKIGLGFVLAILAMVVAALVEIARVRYTPPAGTYLDQAARDNISPCR